ncbi:MAG: HAD family hydrolase [Kiritimatiellae bacterium]|nr:HAD family hydrolase [Kiritimatiellia bacterium]
MKKYVIWDWNGTLLDDVNAAVAALNRMLVKRGLNPTTKEYYRNHFGFPVRPFYAELGVDLDKCDWDEICEDFHNFINEEKDQHLRGDAVEALETLKSKGIGQSILSALRQDLLLRDTAREGVSGYFEHIFGVDNLDGATKLSRAKDLMEALSLPEESQVYFIGDTLHDAEVALSIGATPILIDCGHQNKSRLVGQDYKVANGLIDAVNSI